MNTLELIDTLKPTLTTLAQNGNMSAALKMIDGMRFMRDAYPDNIVTLLTLQDEMGHIAFPNGNIGFIHHSKQGYRAAHINQVRGGYGAGWGTDALNIGSAALDQIQTVEWERDADENYGQTWVTVDGNAYLVQFSSGKVILRVEGKTSEGDPVISVFAVQDRTQPSGWFCEEPEVLDDVLLWCVWPDKAKLTPSSFEQPFQTGEAYLTQLSDEFIAALPVIDYSVPVIVEPLYVV